MAAYMLTGWITCSTLQRISEAKGGFGLMDAKTVLRFAVDEVVKFVDLRFTDLPGSWHHLTVPINQFTEGSFESGIGFDASSLRGWASINESDMLLLPDPTRFWIDPFAEETTMCLIANVVEPIT